jgi:hypothetical protein
LQEGRKININPILELAFRDFEVDGVKIPISFMKYTGKADSFLTYYTWSEVPEIFADDVNHAEAVFSTIDVFSKKNYKKIVEEVKKTLYQNGFTWTDNGSEMYEEDTKFYHVPMNFYCDSSIQE